MKEKIVLLAVLMIAVSGLRANSAPQAKLGKKGIYRIVAVVEPKAEGSGESLVATSIFRLY